MSPKGAAPLEPPTCALHNITENQRKQEEETLISVLHIV